VWLNTSQACPAVIYCPITVTKALTIKLDKYSDSQDILLLYKVIAISFSVIKLTKSLPVYANSVWYFAIGDTARLLAEV